MRVDWIGVDIGNLTIDSSSRLDRRLSMTMVEDGTKDGADDGWEERGERRMTRREEDDSSRNWREEFNSIEFSLIIASSCSLHRLIPASFYYVSRLTDDVMMRWVGAAS